MGRRSIAAAPLLLAVLLAVPLGPAAGVPTYRVPAVGVAAVGVAAAATSDTYAVGDVVWADVDGDGLREPSEPGVPDVEVEVLGADGAVRRSTTTDAEGHWVVDGLAAGVYSARFTDLPAGATFTRPGHGNGGDDSDPDPRTGVTPPFLLGPGGPRLRAPTLADGVRASMMAPTVDAGLIVSTFAIRDQAWRDDDGDGVRDATEPPALGVRVQVVSADDTVVATGRTGSDGEVVLDGVPPGVYRLRYPGLPDGVGFTAPSSATGGSSVRLGTDASAPFTLSPVEYGVHPAVPADHVTAAYVAGGFGVGLTATSYAVGDIVWRDTDGDGVRERDEPGVGGVTVTLLSGGHDMASTTTGTGADLGRYAFDRLPAGRYAVRFTAPSGQSFTAPGRGASGIDSDPGAQGLTAPFTLGPGAAGLHPRDRSDTRAGLTATTVDAGVDAGLVGRTFALGDEVWLDDDGDGVREAGERGAPGVFVVLLDDHGATLATTTTDAAGRYVFDDLAAGVYSVRLATLPPGQAASPPGRGTVETDSDLDPRTLVSLPNDLSASAVGVRAVRASDGVRAAFVDRHVDIGLVPVNGS